MINNNINAPTCVPNFHITQEASLGDFLQTIFGEDSQQEICLRQFAPKDENGNSAKGFFPKNYNYELQKLKKSDFDEYLKAVVQPEEKPHGLYFIPNAGGHINAEINRFTSVFVESDDKSIPEQHRMLDESPIQPSIRIETDKSVHAYWLLENGATREQWLELMRRLINYFGSDASIKNEARLMRLPFFDHIKIIEGKVVRKPVDLVHYEPERRFPIEELLEAFPKLHLVKTLNSPIKQSSIKGDLVVSREKNTILRKGNRNDTLFRLGCGLRAEGLCDDAIEAQLNYINETECDVPLEAEEMAVITKQVLKYTQGSLISDDFNGELFSSWGEMSDVTFEKPDYLIYGVCRGDIAMFEAVTNYGKSSGLRNLAISVACGKGYLFLTEDHEPKKVLLLDYETSPNRFYHDISKMTSVLSDEEHELVKSNFFSYVSKTRGKMVLNLSDPIQLAKLKEEILERDIDIVIIDTLTTAFSIRSENDNAEATNSVMKPLIDLAVRTDTAILFAHHVGKSGSEEGGVSNAAYRARGASAYGAMSTAIYQLDVKQNREGEKVTVLKAPKLKDEPKEEIVISIDPDTRWFEEIPNVDTFNSSEENYRKLIEVITQPMTHQEIEEATPFIKKSTRHRYLKMGIKKGTIEQPKKGVYQPLPYIPFEPENN